MANLNFNKPCFPEVGTPSGLVNKGTLVSETHHRLVASVCLKQNEYVLLYRT